jgi:hypothetical protein
MATIDPDTTFHLWRRYNTAPYRRFALTVTRANTEAGYRMLDHDPIVADPGFLARFEAHMEKPFKSVRTGYVEGGVAVTDMIDDVPPGTDLHYQNAIRAVSAWAALMPKGR